MFLNEIGKDDYIFNILLISFINFGKCKLILDFIPVTHIKQDGTEATRLRKLWDAQTPDRNTAVVKRFIGNRKEYHVGNEKGSSKGSVLHKQGQGEITL